MKKEIDLQGEWLWLAQTMGYCYAEETVHARYHIYWVNGNYKYNDPGGGPQYRLYDLTFSEKEVEANWQMLIAYGKKIGLKGITDGNRKSSTTKSSSPAGPETGRVRRQRG